MRRYLSYANVTATLALVFAMSGGALAANHYLITSTKQVSPKVLKKLIGKTGKTGATGPAGAAGAAGTAGAAGKEGPAGKEGGTGKEGKEGKEGPAGPGIEWALVSASGSIIEQSGGISVSSHASEGQYYLDFPSQVAGHAISATVQDASFPPGGIDAAVCGGGTGGVTCFATGTNDTHHVFVAVVSEKTTEVNKNFYIEVFQ